MKNINQNGGKICEKITKILVALLLLVQISYVSAQMPSYKIKFGEFEITALLDGTVTIDAENLLYNSEKGTATKLLEESFIKNPVEISINAYLIKTKSKLILVDAGAGDLFGGKLSGNIVQSLKSAGYKPSEITDILLTHIHADHSGGLTRNKRKIFENADIHVNSLEFNYWINDQNRKMANENDAGNDPKSFQNALESLSPYIKTGKIKTFTSDIEVLPGIKATLASGHTPGHTVYFLETKGEKMIFWGDLVHIGSVQFIDPLMDDHFDVSLNHGKNKREEFYKKAVSEKYLIAASHISFPGLGHLKFENNHYVWIPIPYSIQGRTN
ncbi:MBL fold metallo-hydrolase [Chryseobacterium paridis]|uniref:MBL fold metallo-hydrolase n=1 Tax=Chryseobacterium paridis TaxID=2800328 RepID=A0ABS1FSF7_9FLAO|nr:MBL fold metallo-hydrolase [Chryseobacterium paridis]MBK1895350.1 MBL fold metallo-hydrolase [Chryseobacterium paridis]